MNEKLQEYKKIVEDDIKLLGYDALRYSLFAGEDNNREEYQVRMEYDGDKYEVYTTHERASVMGKYEFQDFSSARSKFLSIIQLMVLSNRRSVKDNEKPEYPCSLWDK